MKSVLRVIVLLIMSAYSAHALDKVWAGTWKLDPSKSKLPGVTFTFSKMDNGKWHVSVGNTGFDFALDGKDYPMTAPGLTSSFTSSSDTVWDSNVKVNGKEVEKSHYELSSDGKTLKETGSGTHSDGSTFNDVNEYRRMSGTSGFAGKWSSSQPDTAAFDNTVIISTPSDDTIRWDLTDSKAFGEGKTDGSDLHLTGPFPPAGLTWTFTAPAPAKLTWMTKQDGKVLATMAVELGADGRTMTMRTIGPVPDSEDFEVYVKQ